MLMTIADRIKEKRLELQLSQTDLAKRAGYSDKTRISKIENSGNDISMKQVKRIAEALGVTSAYLMGWEEHTKIDAATLNEQFIDRAKRYYEMYANATPEVQSAVELLLKSGQRKK